MMAVEIGDHAIRLRGFVHGRTALAHDYRCAARIRGQGGYLVEIPCALDQSGGFQATLPFSMIAGSHPGGQAAWDLRLVAYPGPELRLGMLTGDLADRRGINVFPDVRCAGPGGPLMLRTRLTRDHDLVLTTTDAALERP